ncbi:hypothetical protein ACFQJD_04570 [Haloplanus sp. GCM10025708]|uniref:hypothetical protein n=1 Tax=Haloferacaceae TaxID=1644056 RepID=UPI0036152A45
MYHRAKRAFTEFHTRVMAAGATLSLSSLGGAAWTFHTGDVVTALGLFLFVVSGGLFVGIGSAERPV